MVSVSAFRLWDVNDNFAKSTGRYVSSAELVPGDVYEVTDPALTQFPCDSILLSGDCIVNESMLTGRPLQYPNPR